MTFALAFGVFICGGAGAWCRFRFDSVIKSVWSRSVPVGTLIINVLGSFLLGLLTALTSGALSLWWSSSGAHLAFVLLGTGFLGGFTTFSTAKVEVAAHARKSRWGAVSFLLLVQPCLAFAAAALGLWLGS